MRCEPEAGEPEISTAEALLVFIIVRPVVNPVEDLSFHDVWQGNWSAVTGWERMASNLSVFTESTIITITLLFVVVLNRLVYQMPGVCE